ncbi:MAG: translation initiation factor IF-3 C-terminal domain-containing protein, partial [Candidatus Hydrogenedentales bacterium]
HVREFLGEGNKVKLTIMFRGREMAHPEFGREILTRVVEDVKDICQEVPDTTYARLEGRNMSVVLTPLKAAVRAKKKTEKVAGDSTPDAPDNNDSAE